MDDDARNLIVNYLPLSVNDEHLHALFGKYGAIESIKVVRDRDTQASKGFGFVKFQRSEHAAEASKELNGFQLMNKRLKVGPASVRPSNGHAPPPPPRQPPEPPQPSTQDEVDQLAWVQQMHQVQQLAALQMMQYQQYLYIQQQQHFLATAYASPPRGRGKNAHRNVPKAEAAVDT